MADNIIINSGSGGATVAADEIAGVHHPRGKVSLGADGVATDAIGVADGLNSVGTGVQAVGLVGQFDDAAPSAVTENQFALVRISSRRAMLVEGVASGTPVTVSGTVDGSNIEGDIAHDSADSGNPLKIGGKALTANPTAVAASDRVNALLDKLGKMVVLGGALEEERVSGTLNRVDTAVADVIVAQGAGIKIAVTCIVISNAHPTVDTKVAVRDDATVKMNVFAPALDAGSPPIVISNGGAPLFVTAANVAVRAICATTGADVDITAFGYRTV